MTCSKGLFPRPFAAAVADVSSSPSESGTSRTEAFFDKGFRDMGGRERRLGGGARRRGTVVWVSFSYSTDVLRGTTGLGLVTPEAQAVLGFVAGSMLFFAAIWSALAILTEVSLTDHLSGFGGDVMIFGPPGRDAKASRCLILANLANAEVLSSSSLSSREDKDGCGRGGERVSRVGALGRKGGDKWECMSGDEKRRQTRMNKKSGQCVEGWEV